MKVCTSCNNELTKDYVEFRCPKCQKARIIRCRHCRATSKAYSCPECGFVGP